MQHEGRFVSLSLFNTILIASSKTSLRPWNCVVLVDMYISRLSDQPPFDSSQSIPYRLWTPFPWHISGLLQQLLGIFGSFSTSPAPPRHPSDRSLEEIENCIKSFLKYFREKKTLHDEECSFNWIFNPTLVPTKITGLLGWCSLIWKLPKCWKSPNTLKKVEEILTSFSHFASTFLKLSGATTEKQARKTSWIYDFVPLFTLDLFLTVSG